MKTELREAALSKQMERIQRELPIEEAKAKETLVFDETKPCQCGREQIPNHGRYQYCDICRQTARIKRQQNYRKNNLERYTEYQRKYRERKRKPPHR